VPRDLHEKTSLSCRIIQAAALSAFGSAFFGVADFFDPFLVAVFFGAAFLAGFAACGALVLVTRPDLVLLVQQRAYPQQLGPDNYC